MTTNREAIEESRRVFPGGVNSPVRAFSAVGGEPPFIASGKGAKIMDIEGRTYIDYVGSWGPLILGHADPYVIETISSTALSGTSFGAPTLRETELAHLIQEAFPSMERMRLVSSGTEATMSAIRVARGYTGRELIVKCDGCYHGHGDSLLVSAGSGVATLGIPGCPGIPHGTASATLVVPFNDQDAMKAVFTAHPAEIAAVIIEPVCGNIGVVPPKDGYLTFLRKLTKESGSLLIFDEVMTGFRSGFCGVQTLFGVDPDITCLGKVVGGGLPLAVYGGSSAIMAKVAPIGPVYQAGTLSGNPLAVASGIATLSKIKNEKSFYPRLDDYTQKLCQGLKDLSALHKIPLQINRFGSMFTSFFSEIPVVDYKTAKISDTNRFARWFKGMLDEGIYLPPSQFEAVFVSGSHGDSELTSTLEASDRVFSKLLAKMS